MTQDLITFIVDELLGGQNDLDPQANRRQLADEVIDSVGVMRLIAFVEETHALKIPIEDITLENFMTVDAIANYLEQRNANDAS